MGRFVAIVGLLSMGCSVFLGGGSDPDAAVEELDAAVDAVIIRDCVSAPDPDAFCAPGICDLLTDTCIPGPRVVFVAIDGDDGGGCTAVSPCATIDRGLAVASNFTTRRTVHVAPGDYNELVVFSPASINEPVRLIGDGARLHSNSAIDESVLIVEANARLRIEGLEIFGDTVASKPGIVTVGELVLFRVNVHSHGGRGVAAITDSAGPSASLTVLASHIHHNGGDGVFDQEGMLALRSSLIYRNQASGVLLVDATVDDLALNTIANNGTFGIQCNGITNATFVGNVVLGTTQVCGSHEYGFVEDATPGPTDLTVPPVLKDPATDDYRLQPGSPGIDFVDVLDVTGEVDVDGGPRMIGSAPNVGAHEELAP